MYLPSYLLKGENSHECIRGRAERMPLMPTSERKARLLLKQGKAFVEQKVPFTIRLNYKTGSTTQLGYLGIDTGSQHIGVSVVREDGTVLHKEEIGLRDSMSKRKLLEAKASLRRGRRYRKTRYRHPKWRPKTKRVYCEVPDRKGRHWQKKKITFTSKRPKDGYRHPCSQKQIIISDGSKNYRIFFRKDTVFLLN